MERGRLRVYLGAAPGVGKTYAMLGEAHRRLERGTDLVAAVNTTGSGLDPDISQANADIQAHRIAAVRRLPMSEVQHLISQSTHGRGLGFSGEPGVNVFELNLALDNAGGSR